MSMRAFRRLFGVAVVFGVMMIVVSVAGASEGGPFGFSSFSIGTTGSTKMVPLGLNGVLEEYEIVNEPYSFTQAGGHPWALTTTGEFASEEIESQPGVTWLVPTRDPKDIVVDLPAGLLGDPLAVPRCPLVLFLGGGKHCPLSTQIGVFRLRYGGGNQELGAISNLTPEAGQSAEFGLELGVGVAKPVLTAHLVRTAQGYGFTVVSNQVPKIELVSFELTFWGVPADPSHDAMRGLSCGSAHVGITGPFQCQPGSGGHPAGVSAIPFLSLETGCSEGPEAATVRADSWEEPGHIGPNQFYEGYVGAQSVLPGVTGCNVLAFHPEIEVQPDTVLADVPVGLGVNVKVPQPEAPGVDATPHLRNAVVTLPEGMSISPGIVDGIQACNASGPEGIDFTGPESEEIGLNGELQLAPGHCPDASTVGEAEAITPLLSEPVKGHVYLARPGCGGAGQATCSERDALDGNLYQLYLELGGKGPLGKTGIVIKVPGYVEADPATGQLTTKFLENPQTPFSELKIRLNGGPRAPIDNPAVCGAALTTADFTPWSAPGITPEGLSVAGTPDVTPSSFFDVEGCENPAGLNPGFTAGTVSPQAGAFSAFTMNLSRQDREQYIKGIQVHTPPGLLGVLASVPLCGEPLADEGKCPESSRIGTTRVASGAGSHPFEISGNVYLTTGYGGSPFGLSIVTDAVAGPFNLGLVVVRARIAVDRETSALTITTDETGRYAIPQILDGVPLRLQRVTVNIDRPDFMFNPTNCAAKQITATISGSQNTTTSVASPFAAASCKSLAFKPSFAVFTSGRTSKANGASLDVKVSYPPGAFGDEANIASVKVELPVRLPSRLTTLQKACTAQVFEANPANCPAASVVGVVRASTPLLAVGLSGPVYFVSHGGEAFPSLIIVLQGDGVRVDLTGATFISKAGITSSTFKTVPDVPVNTFELYLPEGKTSALAANGNLCALTNTALVKHKITKRVHGHTVHKTVTTPKTQAVSLVMPTEMVGQNGAVLKQNTKIEVTECPTTKTKKTVKGKGKAKKSSSVSANQARRSK